MYYMSSFPLIPKAPRVVFPTAKSFSLLLLGIIVSGLMSGFFFPIA